ncbi:MAG: single-stranded DNA-binding protein [Chlorobi bacterium]|nr:MAG: single-stranded DNA-binding protein [Bacteroidota bacterium]KXK35739.1 MAG: Single-stranded DNA-binding protein [Chlorobi bacterium OLB6]MBE2265299.1 single-stranded DNA-binding protein [Flavobacteriales bacterium]MBL1160238.1 single-stranded DNA-binding protein [Chlorobiota bacterium]MBW7853376.1 single-stranded DNA-binding protein [Candidatus Kapabacteria bacterium]MCC6330423.1 single-stranded DNA-binding protein [Ignavibacteria bacterium]
MSRTLNKVMLIGNVGKDPDVNFTSTGIKVAQFRMATTETWRDKEGAVQEQTEWHTIIAWRGLADVVERLVHRASRVYVEGKLQYRTFDDRDGNKRYVTEVVADNILMLDSKKPDAPTVNGEMEKPETSIGLDDYIGGSHTE